MKEAPETDTSDRTPPDPFALVARIKSRGPAPVHLWDPPFCGDIDLVIKRDGSWVHEGKVIRRPAMVNLFASVLKAEDGKYFLVTPVEKVGIQVEDCPFLVTSMEVEQAASGQRLKFGTNTGETVFAGPDHELRIAEEADGEPHPTLHIRSGLQGLLSRAVFYRLVELAEYSTEGNAEVLGVVSDGAFFPLEGRT